MAFCRDHRGCSSRSSALWQQNASTIVSWRKSALPELTELDGVTLGVGVWVGEAWLLVPAEAWSLGVVLALAVGVPDALPEAFAVELALGMLLAVVVSGVASRTAHSASSAERVDTMAWASPRLVAVIELSTWDRSEVGSPATVTASELWTCESLSPASEKSTPW